MDLVCGNLHTEGDYTVHTVELAPDGAPDFRELWTAKLNCDAGMGSGVVESVPVETALQKAVAASAAQADYGDDDTGNLYSVMEGCGSNDPEDYYATSPTFSDAQVLEIRAYLTLCPEHPQASKWLAGIKLSAEADKAAKEVDEAIKNGTRVEDGTYEVPLEMRRGTWVSRSVEDCYWETRNSDGELIANNFVLAAPLCVRLR